MMNPPFPCTVERQPLDQRFTFLHNVVCEDADDLHAGDRIVAIAGVTLVRPITVIVPGSVGAPAINLSHVEVLAG